MDAKVTPEILLAQKLAGNTRKIREKALKRLKLYLETKVKLDKSGKGGFSHVDLLKLWKGLHYCMWMQDKPLLQEELSTSIASLVHAFGHTKTALEYVKCFYITECREWLSIDKWRMDKFLMMFRDILTETFKFLKTQSWNEKLVNLFLDFLNEQIIADHDHTHSPDGVRFHLSQIWLKELSNVGFDTLGSKQSLIFFKPWIKTLAKIKCKTLKASILKNIFGEIVLQSPPLAGARRKSKRDKRLKFSYAQLAKLSMEVGSSGECTSYNRAALYSLSQNFNDVAAGKLPFAPEEDYLENVENITDDHIDEAVQELYDINHEYSKQNKAEKKLHKRSKKMTTEVDEAYVSASGSSEEEQPSAKKAKMEDKVAKKLNKKSNEKSGVLSKRLKQLMEADQQYQEENSEDSDPECDLTDMNSDEEAELVEEDEEFSEGEAELLERGAELHIDDIPSEEEFDMEDFLGQDDDLVDELDCDVPELVPVAETKHKKSNSSKPKTAQHIKPSNTQKITAEPTIKSSKRKKKKNKRSTMGNKNNSNQISEDSDVNSGEPAGVEDLAHSKEKTKKDKKKKKQQKEQNESPFTSPKKKDNGKKTVQTSTDFETVEFDEPGDLVGLQSLKPITPVSHGKKKKIDKKTKPDKSSEKVAKFIRSPDQPKATCLKMSSSKKKRKSEKIDPLSTPTYDSNLKKRISFGKSSSVKKTAVKLRGSSSHDPEKTPEQGILKVNPIQPGTVIQVGKQATLRNTLKNSKFPSRMMASF